VQTEVTELRVSTPLKPKTSRIPNLDLSVQPKNTFPFDPFQCYHTTCFPCLIWLHHTELPDQTSVSMSGVFSLNQRYIAYSSLSSRAYSSLSSSFFFLHSPLAFSQCNLMEYCIIKSLLCMITCYFVCVG